MHNVDLEKMTSGEEWESTAVLVLAGKSTETIGQQPKDLPDCNSTRLQCT